MGQKEAGRVTSGAWRTVVQGLPEKEPRTAEHAEAAAAEPAGVIT
jgi:hypothetical protein